MDKLSARDKILDDVKKLDEFAKAALAGFRLSHRDVRSSPDGVEGIAEDAYAIAEAMISQRYIIMGKKAIEAGIAPVVE